MIGCILWKLCDYTPQFTLKWIKYLARNLKKVLTEVWKDKKTKKNMKKFLSRIKANELYKLPKKRTHEINNRLYWGLGIVPKTNDEIYVSISIGKCITFFHLFYVLCQRRYCCWKNQKWVSHLKNPYHYAKGRISFSISPAPLCNGAVGCINECVKILALKYCQYHTGNLLVFWITAIKALKQGVNFVQT